MAEASGAMASLGVLQIPSIKPFLMHGPKVHHTLGSPHKSVHTCDRLFTPAPQVGPHTVTEHNLHRAKLKLIDFGSSWRARELNVPPPSADASGCDMPGARPPEVRSRREGGKHNQGFRGFSPGAGRGERGRS